MRRGATVGAKGGRVLGVINDMVGFLASGDPHHADGVAITSAGRFWPLGPVGMSGCLVRLLALVSGHNRQIHD